MYAVRHSVCPECGASADDIAMETTTKCQNLIFHLSICGDFSRQLDDSTDLSANHASFDRVHTMDPSSASYIVKQKSRTTLSRAYTSAKVADPTKFYC